MKMERRNFLKWAAGTGLAVGLAPKRALAQMAGSDHTLIFIFMRGGCDAASIIHPEPGTSAARQRYESYRAAGGIRVRNGIPLGGGLAMHPAFQPLQAAINAGHFGFVPGVAGAVLNRSHFQQMDLIESGSSDAVPRTDGLLGRALGQITDPDETLGAIALSATTPYVLRRPGTSSPLAVPNLATVGQLSTTGYSNVVESNLQTRVNRLFVPVSQVCTTNDRYCETGQRAAESVGSLTAILGNATLTGNLAQDTIRMLQADTERRIKMVAMSVGGWDTHNQQGDDTQNGGNFTGTLARNLSGLAGLLRGLYDNARSTGVFSRLTVQVVTEFGRTTYQNGTTGTDHGYGSVGMVMSEGVRARVAPTGWFPASVTNAFYTQAESNNFFPRLYEHRQMFADILQTKFGVTNLSTILPGFTPAASPRLFR